MNAECQQGEKEIIHDWPQKQAYRDQPQQFKAEGPGSDD